MRAIIPGGIAVHAVIAVTLGIFALFLSFPVQHAEAATVTWDGGGDLSSWSDPDNWSGDTLPTSTDTIIIDGNGAVTSNVFLDIDFALDATGSITIDSGDILHSLSIVTLSNSGTINNDGTINNEGGIDSSGTINNEGGIRNFFTGTIDNGGFISNDGTINNEGGIDSSGTINNEGGIDSSGTIDNSGTISSGGTINNDNAITNSGTIDNSGTINNSFINNGGTITNSGIFFNNNAIDNSGTFLNDDGGTIINGLTSIPSTISNFPGGTFTNDGTIDNGLLSTIDNSGTFTNHDTIKNNGNIFNRCGAIFINIGSINGNPLINGECFYFLNLFEGSDPSDGIVNLNQEVTARAETNDVSVDNVRFTWFNPSNVPVDIEIVPLPLSGQAESSFEPNEVGDWTVEAAFNDVVVVRDTVSVPFMVVPESSIGVIALIGSSLAALGVFMFWKRKQGTNQPRSLGDLGI